MVLSAARDQLIAADRKHRDQKAVTTKYRRRRDDAFKPLCTHVQGLRDAFRGTYSPELVEDIGFALRTPQQAGPLFEQATHLHDRLSEEGFELPEARLDVEPLDPPKLAQQMAPMVESLGLALEEVAREESLTVATKIAKDEALEEYERIFMWGAKMAEALFEMADLPEVADRVRPSSRRRGVTAEVEAEDPEIEEPDSDAETEDETSDEGAITDPSDQSPDPEITP